MMRNFYIMNNTIFPRQSSEIFLKFGIQQKKLKIEF